ncbi:MAG: nitroreductase family protein, partial [Candidatus Methanomethylophilaceae archaeon]
MSSINEAIRERHSVRSYTEKNIEKEKVDELRKAIDEYNG